MFDQRLLERLRSMEENPEARMDRNLPRLVNSVIGHLQRLLNTHQGSVPIAEDYGVPDITNAPGEGFLEATQRIERTLQQVIMKYEPRLTNVRMSLLSEKDDVLNLRFKMEGVLVPDRSTRVVFETVVSSDGKVNVSS
ncbi:MAG: type VI secretion system baseplate subunit TssE [Candidatus Latescibacterota bacterium]